MINIKALLVASALTLSVFSFIALSGVTNTSAYAGDAKDSKKVSDTSDTKKDKKTTYGGYKY